MRKSFFGDDRMLGTTWTARLNLVVHTDIYGAVPGLRDARGWR